MTMHVTKRAGMAARLGAVAAALCLAGAGLLVGGTAASASTAPPTSQTRAYLADLHRAADRCEPRTPSTTTLPRVLDCVRDLAAPETSNASLFDLWYIFLDCLSVGWDPGTGFDDDAVNDCLGL